jgi:8-oxo-dGTP pyrophosphatase MutT (NUDIX family)
MVRLPEELIPPGGLIPEEIPNPPVEPRDASTVILLRDGSTGPEVFLQRRVLGMAFAAGMTVFPGGGVDPRDAQPTVRWSGPHPHWWAQRFQCTPELARALVCAAVRETFEESGVLLAGPTEQTVVSDTAEFSAARSALVSRELSLAEFLRDRDLVLRADLLRPWSNWVTPEVEPRRYDARFFLAALPTGQRADGVTTEAAATYWRTPTEALEDWKRGESGLLPPTWVSLTELAEYDSVASAVAAERELDKITPRIVRDQNATRFVFSEEVE